MKHLANQTLVGRDGAILSDCEQYQLADIGMRTLEPHELYAARDRFRRLATRLHAFSGCISLFALGSLPIYIESTGFLPFKPVEAQDV